MPCYHESMKNDIQKYKAALEAELKTVEAELSKISTKNPQNKGEWDAKPDEMDILAADENEVADKIESYDENLAIVSELEMSQKEIKAALERIQKGTYGTCSVGGEPIEAARLDANPSAATCMKHMK